MSTSGWTSAPTGVEATIDDEGRPADLVLSGSPLVVLGLLAGSLDPADHPDTVTGDRAALRHFRMCTQRAVGVL